MKTTTTRNYRQFYAILNKIANQCGDSRYRLFIFYVEDGKNRFYDKINK